MSILVFTFFSLFPQLSAILERDFGLPTTSWWMSERESSSPYSAAPCFVELAGTPTEEVVAEAEERCNSAIRDALDVTVRMCQVGDPELTEVKRGGGTRKEQVSFGKKIFA